MSSRIVQYNIYVKNKQTVNIIAVLGFGGVGNSDSDIVLNP